MNMIIFFITMLDYRRVCHQHSRRAEDTAAVCDRWCIRRAKPARREIFSVWLGELFEWCKLTLTAACPGVGRAETQLLISPHDDSLSAFPVYNIYIYYIYIHIDIYILICIHTLCLWTEVSMRRIYSLDFLGSRVP